MKKLKILMLTSSYPVKNSNLGPFVKNIAKALADQGIEVGVLIFSTTNQYREYYEDQVKIYEYPYVKFLPPMLHTHRGLIPSFKKSLLAKFELPNYFLATRRYLKSISINYDIVHAHWFLPAGFIACSLKKSINRPIITTAWGAEFHLPINFLTRRILSYVNAKSDKVTAVSGYMRSQAKKYGIATENMVVIPNSIDSKKFRIKKKHGEKITITASKRS
jgi:glycosyltransferase involved in cell wall biosynthesis